MLSQVRASTFFQPPARLISTVLPALTAEIMSLLSMSVASFTVEARRCATAPADLAFLSSVLASAKVCLSNGTSH